jgi:hypothetical protein
MKRIIIKKFKIGDTVRWSSQAQGIYKEKQGIVEYIVSANENPEKYNPIIVETYHVRPPSFGYPREHESYIIRVPSKTGKTGKFYRPRVSALEKV